MPQKVLIQFLKENILFQDIPDERLQQLASGMTLVHLSSGEYLLHKGEQGTTAYLLVQGRLRVYEHPDQTHVISEIGVGELVGELAILTDMTRAADVVAVRDSLLIEINQDTFRQWLINHPQSGMKMISTTIKRFLGNAPHTPYPTTLAILPAQEGIDVHAFCQTLMKAISPYKKCYLLSEADETVKRAIGLDQTVPLQYLNTCELNNEFLIYLGSPRLNEWTKQCMRQSDQILMLATPSLKTPLPPIQYLSTEKNIRNKKCLIVLHPPETVIPTHTNILMKATEADEVFHIRNAHDYERIGRVLTGHGIALVLSGGGLRGAAHIGLQFALEENHIPIDMVGGCSFGALAAAGFALQLPREQVDAISDTVQNELPNMMDYTLPVASFVRGERLYKLLTSVFPPDLLLEDLWLPTFCTATNMSDADIKVFDRGPAWECIRASMSLPGIFPPVVHEGKVIVDGASFNNLPIDIMCERHYGGKIIASSVSAELPQEHYHALTEGVSGFDILADRFRKTPHSHLPSLFGLLVNVGFVGSQKHLKQVKPLSDFYLDLDVREYSMMDLKHWKAIIDKGYQEGCALIKSQGLTREALGIK